MTTLYDLEQIPASGVLTSWRYRIADTTARHLTPHTHWALRATLASVFMYHGIQKLTHLERMSEMLQLPLSIVLLVALAETVGGALIVFGGFSKALSVADWLTRIGATMIVPVMVGAIAMVHWGQWSFVANPTHPMGGMEFQVVLLLLSIYFIVNGNEPHRRPHEQLDQYRK